MQVVIVGAGLSGLGLAYLLKKEGIHAVLLEARERPGGRIWTQRIADNVLAEAGATWFGTKHTFLLGLLEELEVGYFPQATDGISLFETMSFAPVQQFSIPTDEPPSYRIAGGSAALIRTLVEKLDPGLIKQGDPVHRISIGPTQSVVVTASASYVADIVISTLPPRLLVHTIDISPELPADLVSISEQTHTWMSDSIKFFVAYPTKFWAARSFSGTAFSQSGIIPEMYDHSSDERFALKGFLASHAYKLGPAEREQAVIKQLVRFFGEEAGHYLQYGDVLWRNEPYTRVPDLDALFPHQNNGHAIFREPLFSGRLFLGGSETAAAFPGYMDGAVQAAHRVADQIKNRKGQ